VTALTSTLPPAAVMQVSSVDPEARKTGYRPVICAAALFAADCAAMLAAAAIAYWCIVLFRSEAQPSHTWIGSEPWRDCVILFAAIVLYLAAKGRYTQPTPFWTETRVVVSAALGAIGMELAFSILQDNILSSTPVVILFLTFLVLAPAANILVKRALSFAAVWMLPVVVIGEKLGAIEAALESDRSLSYHVVGWIDPQTVLDAPAGERLRPVLNHYKARRVLIAVEGDHHREIIKWALRERVPFALIQPYAFSAFPFETTTFFSHDTVLLSFRDGLSRPLARATKVAFDIVAAALLLLVMTPMFLVLILLIRRDGGPALYAHRRIGVHGRPFICLKFRTMVMDADRVLDAAIAQASPLAAEWAATRKLANDPRITWIGRFLRRTSLDELPQLVNILRLEMSLVGPRPIVENEIPLYGESIAQYYAIRPGLTGLWQVSGRSNISYARRVQLDVWYVNNWTMWHDIVVLLKTIPAVLGGEGAR
jgi:Undecaprenyl-phosphate galactose phosphotransferase WbaP